MFVDALASFRKGTHGLACSEHIVDARSRLCWAWELAWD